jgi:hypothetical protein
MLAAMKPDQGFMWRPLVRDGATVAAIEIWKKPGRPAVHPAEAEYAIVLEGSGTLVSGGAMADSKVSNANLIEGSQIEGGVTRTLGPGDVTDPRRRACTGGITGAAGLAAGQLHLDLATAAQCG